MGWWKADPAPVEHIPITKPKPYPSLAPRATEEPSACPVDPKTREIWLQQANTKSQKSKQAQLPPSHPPLPPPPTKSAPTTFTATPSKECSSDNIDQSPIPPQPSISRPKTTHSLSHDRVVSSIPRGSLTTPNPEHTANNNNNNPQTMPPPSSGNWIYPSETQFFNAVMRKQATATSPTDLASSISSIIPIHNAVNERAWSLIKAWEGSSSTSCGGPKLLSFKGLGAGALSPKAKWNGLLGYTSPFDRHDWVVERCGGERVEYVIDFYQGKEDKTGGKIGGNLNFYLDVRPKLNSFEGWKMRAERLMGTR